LKLSSGINILHFLLIMGLSLSTIALSCTKEDISIEERDKRLDKAFAEIESSNEATVISGLKTIRKHPTHKGVHKLILLWEKNASLTLEKEILDTLRSDEVFMKDPSFIEDTFNKYYTMTSSKENKLKLKRLLQFTEVEINKKLIDRIDKDLNEGGGKP